MSAKDSIRTFITAQMDDNSKLWRLTKLALSALVLYFVFITPLMIVLTELVHIHYVFSGFIAGSTIILVFKYVPSWVWRPVTPEEET